MYFLVLFYNHILPGRHVESTNTQFCYHCNGIMSQMNKKIWKSNCMSVMELSDPTVDNLGLPISTTHLYLTIETGTKTAKRIYFLIFNINPNFPSTCL